MNKHILNNSGVSLIATVLTLLIFALFIAIAVSLVTTGSNISLQEEQGTQAFSIAEGGIYRILDAFYNNKIGCNSLIYNSVPLGFGDFTTSGTIITPATTTLSFAILNTAAIIPVVSTAGYELEGRIWIDSEQILYKGISSVAADCLPSNPPCFINITRGYDGTTAQNHASGATVYQKQCRIQSTGQITSNILANPTKRVVETGVPAMAADFLDGGPVTIGTSETTIGSLNTQLGAGDNLIIVVVSFRDTVVNGTNDNINPGNLRLKKGAAVLASNESIIRVGGGTAPGSNVFPQETQFLLYKDIGAAANPTYDVTAIATTANISAEVKIIIINNTPNSSFQDGLNVNIQTTETTILTHASNVPAGDNVIIAAIQLDNPDNSSRQISVGNLRLRKGATVLASNQLVIDLARSNRVNRGTGFLLLARDTNSAANPTYTVTATDTAFGSPRMTGEAKIIVLNGLQSAFITTPAPGYVSLGTTETVIGSLNTTFPAGENIVIAANQFNNVNTNAAPRNIFGYESTTPQPGNERLVFNNTPQSYNQFNITVCDTDLNQCDDFASGLLWHHLRADANPTYDIRASASAAGIRAETKILAIHIKNKIPIYQKENY